MRDDLVRGEATAPLRQQVHLVGQRHGGRVDHEGARPGDLTVRRLGRQLDAPAARPARDECHLPGPVHQVGRLFRPDVDRGGEAHRTVDNDAHAHAEVRVVGRRLGAGVMEAHRLAADALDPELGRLAARRGIERRAGQRGEVVGRERHQTMAVGWRTASPAAV